MKKGQIAHIDRDPSNSCSDNLVFLCLEHHDLYDSTTSQSKGLTKVELSFYRDLLVADVAKRLPQLEATDPVEERMSALPLHHLLANIRKPQLINSLLNGYEIHKANEHNILQIHPFSPDQVSTTGYPLSLGDQALAGENKVWLSVNSLNLKSTDTAIVVMREVIVMPRGLVGRILPYYGSLWRNIEVDPSHVDPGFHGRFCLRITNRGPRLQALRHGISFAMIEFMLVNDPPFDWNRA